MRKHMEYGHYPEVTVPSVLFDRVTVELSHYTVSFAVNGVPGGSGTLVAWDTGFGILTASHVCRHIQAAKDPRIAIICRADLHRLLIHRQHVEFVDLGVAVEESMGPDLALIRIRAPDVLATLKAIKSFYPLRETLPTRFSEHPQKEAALCFILGAPAEFATEEGTRGTPEHVLGVIHFAARAQVTGSFNSCGFDCIRLTVIADRDEFPANYGGISGGGVWHVPLTVDPDKGVDTIAYESPELVGVAFYQTFLQEGIDITAQSFSAFPALLSKINRC